MTAVTPPTPLRFDDLGAVADTAAAGLGLAWLPDWLIRDRVRSGERVQVLTDVPALVFDISATWPGGPHLPMRVRVTLVAEA